MIRTEAYWGHTREFPTGNGKKIDDLYTQLPADKQTALGDIRKMMAEAVLDHDLWMKLDKQVQQDLDQAIVGERLMQEIPLSGLWYQWTWPVVKRPEKFRISMEFGGQEANKLDFEFPKVDVPLLWNDMAIPRRELEISRSAGIPMDTNWLTQQTRNLPEQLDDLYFNGWDGSKNVIYGLVDLGTGTGSLDRPIPVAEDTATAWDAIMGAVIDFGKQYAKFLAADFLGKVTPVVTPYQYGLLALPLEGPAASQYIQMTGLEFIERSPFYNPTVMTKQIDYGTYNAADGDCAIIQFPGNFKIGVGAGLTADPARSDGSQTTMRIWCAKTIRQNSYLNGSTYYKAMVLWTTDTAA